MHARRQQAGVDRVLDVRHRRLVAGAVELGARPERVGLGARGGGDRRAGGVVRPDDLAVRVRRRPARRRPGVPARRLLERGGHRVAVRGRVAVEPVGALQQFVRRVGVDRRRRAVDLVVGRHDPGHVRVLHQALELLGVVVADVGVRGVRAAREPVVLLVVQREVLGGGRDLQVRRHGLAAQRLALVAVDERVRHRRRQVRVLAERLVGPAPARVTVHVHRRRPVREAAVVAGGGAQVVLPGAEQRLVEEPACLVGDRGRLLVDEARVPRHRRGEVHREARRLRVELALAARRRVRAKPVDAVLALAPVRVLLHAEPGDRGRVVRLQLLDLLAERHAGHQVSGALGERVARVQVERRGGRSRDGAGRRRGRGRIDRRGRRRRGLFRRLDHRDGGDEADRARGGQRLPRRRPRSAGAESAEPEPAEPGL